MGDDRQPQAISQQPAAQQPSTADQIADALCGGLLQYEEDPKKAQIEAFNKSKVIRGCSPIPAGWKMPELNPDGSVRQPKSK